MSENKEIKSRLDQIKETYYLSRYNNLKCRFTKQLNKDAPKCINTKGSFVLKHIPGLNKYGQSIK